MKKLLGLNAFLLFYTGAIYPQCDTFVGTDYTQGKVFVFEKGEMVWTHDAPFSNDVWVLDNGNLLFTTGDGVLEVTRTNDTVFHYQSKSMIFACQRLKNGNTFVGECNSGRLLEISPKGKIVKEICILPEGVNDGGKPFIRNARRLDNGHYLVAHFGGKKAVEYDAKGKIVWSVPVPGGAHSVIRLPNGNTIVAETDAVKNPRILEFNKKGELVWELSNKDLEGEPLKFLTGMQYIPDTGLYFTNWQGHGVNEKKPFLFLVNRDKQILCSFPAREEVESFSSVCFPQKKGTKIYH